MNLYPFIFEPRFKERVWGGRNLQALYGKPLPGTGPIGESWEISDRPGDVSLIANGPLAGKDLHWLLTNHPRDLLGETQQYKDRFPLLVKILDAQEKLSLQVHPPEARAASVGGEPKTEMWYIAGANPGAELYVGLRAGTSRELFIEKLKAGTVADCFHRITVKTGDVMFLPSGRVHALGAGLVIFEVQQNSDTTYRVFDWNRVGLDGKPRELHLAESLASIDFEDFEPGLVRPDYKEAGKIRRAVLVDSPLFEVQSIKAEEGALVAVQRGVMQIFGVVEGTLRSEGGSAELSLNAGHFCLVPAAAEKMAFRAFQNCQVLCIRAGAS